jgi:hypothetical protein
LEEGFLRLRCESCHAEKLVAFSCKKRGFCPSCGARRMAETAALLADEVLPERPLRQWVLSLPHALRFLLATNPAALTQVLGVVNRAISGYLRDFLGWVPPDFLSSDPPDFPGWGPPISWMGTIVGAAEGGIPARYRVVGNHEREGRDGQQEHHGGTIQGDRAAAARRPQPARDRPRP